MSSSYQNKSVSKYRFGAACYWSEINHKITDCNREVHTLLVLFIYLQQLLEVSINCLVSS